MGATVKVSQQLKAFDKVMAAEGKTVFRAETKAEAAGAPVECSSMEWTSKSSNDASTQDKCNRWALKETPTSPRSAKRPEIKDTLISNALGEI